MREPHRVVVHFSHHLVVHGEHNLEPGILDLHHVVRQHVPAGRLRHVLHQLAAIGLDAGPLPGVLVHAHVAYLALGRHLRVQVAQAPAAGQSDAQPGAIALGLEVRTRRECDTGGGDRIHDGAGQALPQFARFDVCVTPLDLQRLARDPHVALQPVRGAPVLGGPLVHPFGLREGALVGGQPHGFGQLVQVQVVHDGERDERAHSTLVPERQLHHLADLAHVVVDRVRRGVERSGVRRLVHIFTLARVEVRERLQLPLFARQERQHPAFDVGQVGHRQLAPGWRHDAPPHDVGHDAHRLVVHQVQRVDLERVDHQLLHLVAFHVTVRALHVVRLEDAATPALGAQRGSELQRVAQPPVRRHAVHYRLVLRAASHACFEPDHQQRSHPLGQLRVFHPTAQRVGRQVGQVDAVLGQDELEQLVALGGAGDSSRRLGMDSRFQRSLGPCGGLHGGVGQVQVHGETTVVDLLVENPQLVLEPAVAHVPHRQLRAREAHGHDVLQAVVDELLPLVRVCLARGAAQLVVLRPRFAEQLNQFLAALALGLVLVELEHRADLLQRPG